MVNCRLLCQQDIKILSRLEFVGRTVHASHPSVVFGLNLYQAHWILCQWPLTHFTVTSRITIIFSFQPSIFSQFESALLRARYNLLKDRWYRFTEPFPHLCLFSMLGLACQWTQTPASGCHVSFRSRLASFLQQPICGRDPQSLTRMLKLSIPWLLRLLFFGGGGSRRGQYQCFLNIRH